MTSSIYSQTLVPEFDFFIIISQSHFFLPEKKSALINCATHPSNQRNAMSIGMAELWSTSQWRCGFRRWRPKSALTAHGESEYRSNYVISALDVKNCRGGVQKSFGNYTETEEYSTLKRTLIKGFGRPRPSASANSKTLKV